MEWLKGQTNRRKEKEHELFLEALKKVMKERMTGPDYPFSIPAPNETDQECFEKLKREILAIALIESLPESKQCQHQFSERFEQKTQAFFSAALATQNDDKFSFIDYLWIFYYNVP